LINVSAGLIGCRVSSSILVENRIGENTELGLGVISLVNSARIPDGSTGVGDTSGVLVIVGVRVIVGVSVMVGVRVIVNVNVGDGEGGNNWYATGSAY